MCAKKLYSLVRRLQLPFRHAQAHDKYIPNYACLNILYDITPEDSEKTSSDMLLIAGQVDGVNIYECDSAFCCLCCSFAMLL